VNSRLAAGLWLTRVDASEIENAVLNLAINARDAMPNGGTILIETSNATLTAHDVEQSADIQPGEYVKLAVTDTGTGMSPEIAARVFEPFFTTKEPGRGTGLGLSTIYGFVKQSGGFAAIYSELRKGTVVNLYLPRDQSDAQIHPAPEPVDETARPVDETVLVVEDNEQLRDLAVRRLAPLGYKLATAASGPAAIAHLDKGQPVDLVFTDVVMPGGMSGLDLMRWVNEHRPDVRVLLTSGFAAELVSETAGAGIDAPLLRKPYTQTELAAAVREALSGRPQGERTSAAKT
jgi:CheY-like chemotaxis protein